MYVYVYEDKCFQYINFVSAFPLYIKCGMHLNVMGLIQKVFDLLVYGCVLGSVMVESMRLSRAWETELHTLIAYLVDIDEIATL